MCRVFAFLAFVGALLTVAPAGAQSHIGVSPAQMFGCNQATVFSGATATTQLIASPSGISQIYICGFNFMSTAGGTLQFETGTQATTPCDTGPANFLPAFPVPPNFPLIDHQPYYAGITPVPSGKQLCLVISGTGPVNGIVYYTQF